METFFFKNHGENEADLLFLCEMKPTVRLSKTVGEIFEIFCVHLRFRFVFSKVYITFSTKNMDYLTLKCHNFFQN